MTNYRSVKEKKEYSKKRMMFIGLLLFCILAFTGVYRALSLGVSPLSRVFWRAANSDASLRFVLLDKRHMQKEIKELRSEISRLESHLLHADMRVQTDTARLFDILETRREEPRVAGILVKPNHNLYNTLIIDQGSQHDIEVGDVIVAHGFVALGFVADVRSRSSHVELFSTNNIQTQVVHVPTGVFVDLEGSGGSMMRFLAPRDLDVAVGDTLALPGSESFLVGVVEDVRFDSTDPVQTVLVRSATNVQELRFVYIVDGYDYE